MVSLLTVIYICWTHLRTGDATFTPLNEVELRKGILYSETYQISIGILKIDRIKSLGFDLVRGRFQISKSALFI